MLHPAVHLTILRGVIGHHLGHIGEGIGLLPIFSLFHNFLAFLPLTNDCLFHFKQAIIRHAYSTGLKADYDIIGNPVRSAIQMLGALAWVPEEEVVEAYHITKPTLSSDFAEFVQYFEEFLIGPPTLFARYQPIQCNQYKAILSIICRSSNVVKGWHNSFYSLVECYHPSLHIFFEAMLNEHALTSVKIGAHNQKRLTAKRHTKWLDLEKLQNDQCEAYDIEKKKKYEKET